MIVDGVAFPKKGEHSVGVGRQWCGVSGKVDNCQVAVNLTLATPGDQRNADQVSWPMGMQLYLPKKWAGDDDSMLTHAFVAEQRLRTGDDGTGLDSFEKVVRRLPHEAAVQRLIDNHGFNRRTAEEVAVGLLRGFSEWK